MKKPAAPTHNLVAAARQEIASAAELLRRRQVARNVNEAFQDQLTFGERVADRMASFAGSWTFILLFALIIVVWMSINAFVLVTRPFDPYPFILLNLVLSTLAAMQAPVIMMSQNRQADKDRLQADLDYQVNLKAEAEVAALHLKLDGLHMEQWEMLLSAQQRQLELLVRLAERLGAAPGDER